MRKLKTTVACIVSVLVLYSCQTTKPQEPLEEETPITAEQNADDMRVVEETPSSAPEIIEEEPVPLVEDLTTVEETPKQESGETQQEFIPIYTQDIQEKDNTADEFIPVTDDSLVIDLTPKKEESSARVVKPILRPRNTTDSTSSAKIWNSEENIPDVKPQPNPVEEITEPEANLSINNSELPISLPSENTNSAEDLIIQPLQTDQPKFNQDIPSPVISIENETSVEPVVIAQDEKKTDIQTDKKTDIPEQQQEASSTDYSPIITKVEPSRSVTVKNNQYIDVSYPGSGWVYIGEEGGSALLSYFGRKTVDNTTIFTLRTKESGKTLLHFYKVDALSGNYIDDYLEVVIEPDSTNHQERFQVPLYEMANALTASEPIVQMDESAPATVPRQNPDWASSIAAEPDVEILFSEESDIAVLSNAVESDQLLAEAKEAFNEAEYEKSLRILDDFLRISIDKLDEALFLKGQIYETPSSQRNIRKALESYETLVKAYPSSSLWKQANDRITYLEKFYFTIN